MNIQETYRTKVVPALEKQFGYGNVMAVPRVEKVVINVGVGRLREPKEHEEVLRYLALITGQRPHPRLARRAIAAFKSRIGMTVGYRVTLRGKRMFDFLTRFIHIALPRTRDFRGIPVSSFDANGNLTIGVKEHIVFPEMTGEDYRLLFGFEVTVVTTAERREEGVLLFKSLGFPMRGD